MEVCPSLILDDMNNDARSTDARPSWGSLYSGDARDYVPPDPHMMERVSRLAPARALDVGCGAGGLCVALSELGWQVTGIDIAHQAIAAARRVAQARRVDATFVTADATMWQPPQQYDLVTCHFGVPPSPSDRQAIYAMMRRALASGGIVLMKFCEGNVSGIPALAGYDSLSVREVSTALDGFEIATPEYVLIRAHTRGAHNNAERREVSCVDDGGEYWTAVLFEGRKPR
jgi:SAM-dependent methyltransferase